MNADIIVVGGGLAGGLIALRLNAVHPQKKVLLLEQGQRLGGNHTWNFFGPEKETLWFEELITKTWDALDVRFPSSERTIECRIHSLRPESFHETLMKRLGRNVRLECAVVEISDCHVKTSTGEVLRAPLVIDASGISPEHTTHKTFAGAPCGWMKFIGFDLKLKKPHGLQRPIWVDATVPQMDGHRYFTCQPWDESRVFVQEQFLSSTPDLNHARISRSILAYAERAGWEVESIEREETGCRPMPMHSLSFDKTPKVLEVSGEDFEDESPIAISSRFGWFHSSTTQSLPDAVRLAEFISSLEQLRTGPARADLRDYRKNWIEQQTFYRRLNRLIYRAVEPSLRYQIMERFYGLRDDVISRYFAGMSDRADRPKIMGAKPFVRPGRATKNWADDSATTPSAETAKLPAEI